eukprot:1151557-Pelagomonas_calceolata.AAC.2
MQLSSGNPCCAMYRTCNQMPKVCRVSDTDTIRCHDGPRMAQGLHDACKMARHSCPLRRVTYGGQNEASFAFSLLFYKHAAVASFFENSGEGAKLSLPPISTHAHTINVICSPVAQSLQLICP